MFHRTTLVANDRVLTRGGDDRSHQRRAPLRPQRDAGAADGRRAAGLPAARDPARPGRDDVGATVDPRRDRQAAAVPRAAAAPAGRLARGGLVDPSAATGRRPDAHVRSARRRAIAPASPYSSYASPHVYNPPRPVAPSARASNQPALAQHRRRASTTRPPRTARRTSTTRRRLATARTSTTRQPPAAAPHIYNPPPANGAPHTFGAPPTHSPARTYNPPPRRSARRHVR